MVNSSQFFNGLTAVNLTPYHLQIDTIITPVSYTHLDVYKRQTVSKFNISLLAH